MLVKNLLSLLQFKTVIVMKGNQSEEDTLFIYSIAHY